MALFPAYASISASTAQKDEKSAPSVAESTSWPQFSSFQPPPPPKPAQEPKKDVIFVESDDEVEIIEERDVGHRKRRHKRKEKKVKRKRRRRSPSSSSSSSDKESISKSKSIDRPIAAPKWSLLKSSGIEMGFGDDLFVLDNRRDIENLRYESIYKGHLAKFNDRHYRRCFGNSSQRIDRLFFGDPITDDKEKWRRYYKRSKNDLSIGEIKSIVIKSDDRSAVELLPEFIPIDNKMTMDGQTFVYDSKLQMYRPLDSVDSSSMDPSEEGLESGSALALENRRLNRLLAENPKNIDLWRQFLRLQDQLFSEHGGTKAITKEEKSTSKLAHLERKLSVLDKAIEKNPSNVELKMLRLHIGRELGWDLGRQRDEWRRLEFNHINDPPMWIGRLRFENGGDFAHFSINRLGALYDHCLERFSTVLSGQLITHPPPANGERFLMDFLMGKVRFLLDCGHTEQAVASLQALLEFNFKQPPALEKLPAIEKRKFFEPFWDSNQARFGEDGAVGWAETIKRPLEPAGPSVDISAQEDDVCRKGAGLRDAGLWLELERLRESSYWIPWRSAEEPEDPQRVVLFDDISGVLYEVTDPSNRFRLFLETLRFFGMHLPELHSSNTRAWYDEEPSFQALENFELLPRLRHQSLTQNEEFLERLWLEIDKLLPDSSVYKTFLISARFHHAATTLSKEDLPAKEKLKRYRKMAKTVLDDDRWRDRLIFYHAYASGLSKLNAFAEAVTVADTALTAAPTSSKSIIDQLALLGLLCIWTENRLFHESDGNVMEVITERLARWLTTSILKAKSSLAQRLADWKATWKIQQEDQEQALITSWMGSTGSLLTHLAALFTYASTSGNLSSSRDIYAETRQFLKPRSQDTDLERLWIWEVRLIDHHLRSNSSAPPRLLLECLEGALADFPANPYFLKLYVDKHLRGQLMVKLRRFFDHRHENWPAQETPCSSSLEISFMAAIYSEFSRYVKLKDEQDDDLAAGGSILETNRLRHVLAKAVETCPNSVILWRLRFTLESYLGDRAGLERAFYLGIRQCPWSKGLYMDAIGLLPEKGQSIVDLMMEKGLRVRVPWEELQLLRKAMDRDSGANVE